MIVFAALVPHSPLLIPSIGKENTDRLAKTKEAYQHLEERLYISQPTTLVVISPHAPHYPDAWSANIGPDFQGSLKEFGDHSTTVSAHVNFLLSDRVHRGLREKQIPFTLRSDATLDYGYTIPLCFLTTHLTRWSLLPLAPSARPLEEQIAAGKALNPILHGHEQRIAVIASADLSHHLNPSSPGGEKPEATQFDQAAREALRTHNPTPLLGLSEDVKTNAGQCGAATIAMLLGILQDLNCRPEELCYEAPFGVGYLTVNYTIA